MTKVLERNGVNEMTFNPTKFSACMACMLSAMAFVAFTLPLMLFCEEDAGASAGLVAAVVKICNDIGTFLTAIINPVCAVLIGVSLFSIIFGTNSKSTEEAISRIKKIFICFVVFNCLGLILTYGTSLMSNIGGQYW